MEKGSFGFCGLCCTSLSSVTRPGARAPGAAPTPPPPRESQGGWSRKSFESKDVRTDAASVGEGKVSTPLGRGHRWVSTAETLWGGGAHLTSPSLCHGLPFWGYLLWLWRFFCPPSANLHSKGSVGAAQKGKENKMMFGDLRPVTHQRCQPPPPPPRLHRSISSSALPPNGALRQNSRHKQQ